MLNPEIRKLYLRELRPPIGYHLDRAIGTTYSLDLLSLLMAPLSLSFFEMEKKEDIFKNPIALIDAIRNTSDKFAIFCQKGKIKVPKNDTRLYQYLEPIVNEVKPENKEGVFHPKIWVMRFTSKDKPIFYRFLCFSRNITFDNSWDTVLRLEGMYKKERNNNYTRNYPLSDFIKNLPDLSCTSLDENTKKHINIISQEIPKVKFNTPSHFKDKIEFIPSGINGYEKIDKFKDYTRIMTISPFLSENILSNLYQNPDRQNILISKGESLDQINNGLLSNIKEKANIYILDEEAERPEENEEDRDIEITENDFTGLHAKLFIMEKGWDARILTGSANATSAAINGKNVEFMVGLEGKKSKVGIDSLMGNTEENTSFRDLLKIYKTTEVDKPDDKLNTLKKRLDKLVKEFYLNNFTAEIEKNMDQSYSYLIKTDNVIKYSDIKIEGEVYPIALGENNSKDISPLLKGKQLKFSSVSILALTSFVAFKIKVKNQNEEIETSFVLNLPVQGMPEERNKNLLRNILDSENKFVRYLLFLLSNEDNKIAQLMNLEHKYSFKSTNDQININIPLLEELVQAYSRNPDKIKEIKKLVEELTEDGKENKILPKGFSKVWDPILEGINRGEKNNG